MRGLRTLAPVRPVDYRLTRGNQRVWRMAVGLALLAIATEFAISANTLADLGIRYAETGGSPLVKFQPGTYLITLATALILCFSRPAGTELVRLFRETPALAMFNVLILACALYSISNVGVSGAAVYVESYLSAGLLAIVLRYATDRQRRGLAWLLLFFCILSTFLSIYEGTIQTHLIPLHIGDDETQKALLVEDAQDFRGAGLFAHPLTAALAASMAVFLLFRMTINGLLKGILFTILLIGLLSFGGRAALAVTVALVTVGAAVRLLIGMARRDLPLSFVSALIAGILILPPVLLVVITSTDIGDRIIAHMYLDDSAEVRNIQWLVLGHLNTHDVLFGVPMARLEILKYQIGLGAANVDIENFWLLMFLNLGIMGFAVFLVALALLLIHLGRTTAHPLGWALLLGSIIIDSTSNSLGRKSIDLVMLVAFMEAMKGYDRIPVRRAVLARAMRRPVLQRLPARPVNLAGMKP